MNKNPTISLPLLIVVWSFVALLMALQLFLRFTYEGGTPSFVVLVLIQLLAWSIWLGLTPIIIQLGKRFRLSKTHWKSGLLFHIPFSIIIVLFFLVCYVLIFMIINQSNFTLKGFTDLYLLFYFQIFQWCWLIYWAVLGISYAVEYQQKFQEREVKALKLEKDLETAQLQALRMQLQPHFLFNTLHTIGAKVRLDESQSAVKMLSILSDLLRKILQSETVQQVSLAEELTFIKEYLALEQIRFKNRLDIQYQLDDNSQAHLVPNLILQPVIENAIKHGFSKKLDAQTLRISSEKQSDGLLLTVYNDGPPIDHNLKEGIGLSNTRNRLIHLYNNADLFSISNKGNGVEVCIKIPNNSLKS